VHPFLLAAYSVLTLLAANLEDARIDEAMTTMMIVVAGTGLLYLALRRVLPRRPSRAGLVTSLLLLVGLFYGYLAAVLSWLLGVIGPNTLVNLATLFVVVVFLSFAIAFIVRTRRRLDHVDRILNIVTLGLVIV
jgi:hypothetical protein